MHRARKRPKEIIEMRKSFLTGLGAIALAALAGAADAPLDEKSLSA